MALQLTEQEIKFRLQRLSNLERLYAERKVKYEEIKQENETLKAIIKSQSEIIEQQQLRIEELEKMVFGRKKKKKSPNSNDEIDRRNDEPPRSQANRLPDSYRRPQPSDDEVTEIKYHPLNTCPDCGAPLTKIRIIERLVEDIEPLSNWFKKLKRVIKQKIATGFCPHCHARKTAIPISPQTVSLGENTKQFVAFAAVILRHSYEQIQDFLAGTIHLNLSDGEITNILTEQGIKLHPEFEALKGRIRSQPGVHFDETSWSVQACEQGNYAWVNTGTITPETVFLFGRSRGKGNIAEFTGKDPPQALVAITDDYGAYRNTFSKHQLCWSHPHRKFRDLNNSESLIAAKKQHCHEVFERFSRLYADVRETLTIPFNLKQRKRKRQLLRKRFDRIVAPDSNDPVKLAKIKKGLRDRKECYFTCVTEKDVPCDNNKAERALRHIVLKRRNCFGSKTQRAADLSSILYSVLLSLWWKSKQTFFQEYSDLLASSV